MPILCEFISVIIRRDSIDKYFQGGWFRFVIDPQNGSMCCDGEIVNLGFMNPNDVQKYLSYLVDKGLQYEQSSKDPTLIRKIDDIIVLDLFNGYHGKARWLEYGDRKFDGEDYFCCWLKESAVQTLAFSEFREGKFIHRVPFSIKPSEFERFKFVKTKNDLDIYLDTSSAREAEYFMPHGMSINEYYVQFKPEREIHDAKTKAIAKEKNSEEKRLIEDKKAEEKLYDKVTKKTAVSNPMDVIEKLIERALKTNDSKDIDLIDEFWHDNGFGFLDFEAGDNFYASVDPHEVIVQMKFHWDQYVGSDESERDEMSEEDLFNFFKRRIEYEFDESGTLYVKKFGKYLLSAYISDPREGRFTDFSIHNNAKELDDLYKNSGQFYMGGSDEGNWNDQILRAFFDEHY